MLTTRLSDVMTGCGGKDTTCSRRSTPARTRSTNGMSRCRPASRVRLYRPEPLDDERDRLRHDPHRPHQGDDDEQQQQPQDEVADDRADRGGRADGRDHAVSSGRCGREWDGGRRGKRAGRGSVAGSAAHGAGHGRVVDDGGRAVDGDDAHLGARPRAGRLVGAARRPHLAGQLDPAAVHVDVLDHHGEPADLRRGVRLHRAGPGRAGGAAATAGCETSSSTDTAAKTTICSGKGAPSRWAMPAATAPPANISSTRSRETISITTRSSAAPHHHSQSIADPSPAGAPAPRGAAPARPRRGGACTDPRGTLCQMWGRRGARSAGPRAASDGPARWVSAPRGPTSDPRAARPRAAGRTPRRAARR